MIESTPLDDWKTYMTWHMVNNVAAWLSDDFVQEDFKFQQAITGQKEIAGALETLRQPDRQLAG